MQYAKKLFFCKKHLIFFSGYDIIVKRSRDGHLAQLVELSLDVRRVSGSSPLVSTIVKGKDLSLSPFNFSCRPEHHQDNQTGVWQNIKFCHTLLYAKCISNNGYVYK